MIDFMPTLQSMQDARDAADTMYEESFRVNSDHFYGDVQRGRGEQIARVINGRSYTLANELRDAVNEDDLFLLLQAAMNGQDVGQMARNLVSDAADKFAEVTTEYGE